MLHGLMQETPLLITAIMRFASRYHGDREIVSVTSDNPRHRYTYKEAFGRAGQAAHALGKLGMQPGDRVGTLAWNDHRHFELYYGISCSAGVCHTINPRLFGEQIEYIVNHAEDRWLFIDPLFVPLVTDLLPRLATVESVVVLTDRAHMPAGVPAEFLCYEELIASHDGDYDWPELDENTACSLCYTSGTTGNPKGVLFSHRAMVLHSYAIVLPDVMGLGARDCVMPLVPMFHVNAWGTPYAVPMVGAKLVLAGPQMADGPTLHDLIETEQVNYSLGVPTVWLALLDYLQQAGQRLTALRQVCVGGAACPAVIIDQFAEQHGVEVNHAWGMTELSPVGAYNTLKSNAAQLSAEELQALRLRQGRPMFGVEMRIVDDAGTELPWDGESFGALQIRGPWVCRAYYKDDEPLLDAEGWFDTGDVATINAAGFMQITDRRKDVIKSGGEWISSIALENIAVNHPAVVEAAVIGIAHPKWQERPLLIVVLASGATLTRDELLAWFDDKVASWWVPDDVAFVDELPHTATGKLLKTRLREMFAAYRLPGTDA